MIKINPISWEEGIFFEIDPDGFSSTVAIGPFRKDGTIILPDPLVITADMDSMTESRGRFRENNVHHVKVEGDIYFNTYDYNVIPAPTSTAPERVAVKTKSGTTRYWGLGFPTPGRTYSSGTSQVSNYKWAGPSSDGFWHVYRVHWRQSVPNAFIWAIHDEYRVENGVMKRYTTEIAPKGGIASQVYDTLSRSSDAAAYFGSLVGRDDVDIHARRSANSSSTKVNIDPRSYWTLSGIVDAVKMRASVLQHKVAKPRLKDYGDLVVDAIDQKNAININMIAFLKDLRDPMSMIPKLKGLKSLKGNANNFLSVKYGLLPTMSDLKRIVRAFQSRKPFLDSNGFVVNTARHRDVLDSVTSRTELEQHLKIAIDKEDSDFKALCESVESVGMALTFENVWDLVPYSFVVDWFLGVGDFLERCDTRMRMLRLNIKYATMSYKMTTSTDVIGENIPVHGTLKVVEYHRWVTDHCPMPRLALGSQLKDFNHWLESGALLIQRAK